MNAVNLLCSLIILWSAAPAAQLPDQPRGGRPVTPERQPAPRRPGARSPQPEAQSGRSIEMVEIKFGNLKEVANIVTHMLSLEVIPDERTQHLIISGTVDEIEKAAELIALLDRPSASDQGHGVTIVAIEHRDPSDIAMTLSQIYHPDVKVSIDQASRRLLLRGTAVEAAQETIRELDTVLPTVTVDFAFIRTSRQDEGEPLPEDLARVGHQIARFGAPRLVGRLTTVATQNQGFSVSGAIEGINSVQVSGELQSASETGAVRLRVDARLEERSNFQLETVVTLKRGEHLVLGSAPHGSEIGESVILVIHVPETGE